MRLVKAFAWVTPSFVALFSSLLLTGGACDDEKPAPLSAADCEPTLRLPTAPVIMEVHRDGSVHAGPSCATANCLAGTQGTWGYKDAASTITIEIGSRTIRLPPPDPSAPPSRFAAQHALRGFVIGAHVALIDRGDQIEVAMEDGSTTVPMIEFRAGEELGGAYRVDGGVLAWVRNAKRPALGRTVTIVPPRRAPGSPSTSATESSAASAASATAGRPILEHEQVVGWFYPSSSDSEPASFELTGPAVPSPHISVTTAQERAPLPMPLPLSADGSWSASARFVSGRLLISANKRTWLVSRSGALITELAHGVTPSGHERNLFLIDSNLPGPRVQRVTDGDTIEPWIAPRPGHDLAGLAVPDGARTERLQVQPANNLALFIERRRLKTCTVEDRLFFLDLMRAEVRLLASDDVVRIHPTWAGDRFRFVQADATYESP